MRGARLLVLLAVGCGGAPPPTETPPEAPPPRARLLDEELRPPEGDEDAPLRLEMPRLGSDLPRVIVVPAEDAAEGDEDP